MYSSIRHTTPRKDHENYLLLSAPVSFLFAVADNARAVFPALESDDSFNTGVGTLVLQFVSGKFNTGAGYQALSVNTFGESNTALGAETLLSNTTGNGNTAAGDHALRSNLTGTENTAIGALALFANTSGVSNTAIGYLSLTLNINGQANTTTGWGRSARIRMALTTPPAVPTYCSPMAPANQTPARVGARWARTLTAATIPPSATSRCFRISREPKIPRSGAMPCMLILQAVATMRVVVEETVAAATDKVFAVIGDFAALENNEMIKDFTVTGTGVGAVRSITLANGGVFEERLEKHDGPARTFTYAIINE